MTDTKDRLYDVAFLQNTIKEFNSAKEKFELISQQCYTILEIIIPIYLKHKLTKTSKPGISSYGFQEVKIHIGCNDKYIDTTLTVEWLSDEYNEEFTFPIQWFEMNEEDLIKAASEDIKLKLKQKAEDELKVKTLQVEIAANREKDLLKELIKKHGIPEGI